MNKERLQENGFNIIKSLAVLREGSNGWRQELNFVSWNGKDAKYDIRWWSSDRSRCGKGITLREEELHKLKEILID